VETCWLKEGLVAYVGVVVGDFYFLKINHHVINEKLYVQRGKDIIWQQVAEGVMMENKKKLV
jgi:hypothetical protein